VSDDHKEADTETEDGGIQPERRKIYDVEEEPDKDFWTEIKSKHQLKRTDYSHLPDSLKEIRKSDKYEIEPLFAASTIQEAIQEAESLEELEEVFP